jgi:aspartyl-tRNA(Asn)/glutamyl-tRNA(Gln) amidotransferase subunit B
MDALYKPTIGLEIHAELKTRTKLFCASKNDPDETNPNVNVCPICVGHPGTLPVLNKSAVAHILLIGRALGGVVARHTYFDRKNYFYPDIPKGYQISQYEHPLVKGGNLADVVITRIHLEEDTARSMHDKEGSLVDFNRAGVPLMELVTEPVIQSAEHAVKFARELQLLLRVLNVGDANLEKGEMRIEANVSVSATDQKGTKVEVKNLNSFKAVERAILFEVKRQCSVLKKGGEVLQETRGWDGDKQQTVSQRLKEESHDYRYFPDPDLVPLDTHALFGQSLFDAKLPELPWEKRKRFAAFGLTTDQVEILVGNNLLGDFFDEELKILGSNEEQIRNAANYLTSDIISLGMGKSVGNLTPDAVAQVSVMVCAGELSSRGAKDVLAYMYEHGGEPRTVAEEKELMQNSNEEFLEEIVQQVIDEHKTVADEYRDGKETSLQFLIGQGMKMTKGAANPRLLAKLFQGRLK